MITEGKHPARALGYEFGITPNTGTRYIRISFEVTSGEHAGQSVTWNGWLTEKTLERTLDSLECTGWDGASISNPVGIGSADCVIDVEHEESNDGKRFARVKWVNRPGAGKLKEDQRLDPGSVSGLDREFRASLLERRQSRPAPARQQAGRPPVRPRVRPVDDYEFMPPEDYDDGPPV
jgi:hypothetical protein